MYSPIWKKLRRYTFLHPLFSRNLAHHPLPTQASSRWSRRMAEHLHNLQCSGCWDYHAEGSTWVQSLQDLHSRGFLHRGWTCQPSRSGFSQITEKKLDFCLLVVEHGHDHQCLRGQQNLRSVLPWTIWKITIELIPRKWFVDSLHMPDLDSEWL